MKIWANTIVNNEENFIWFALMSVVDFVDKILVWDTGSKDNTVKIISDIRKTKLGKIDFKELGPVNKHEFTKARQQMLDASDCDWILLLDGDEVWWEDSIKKVVNTIQRKGDGLDAVVVPFYNLVGDIYHYQPEQAGEYKLLDRIGHLTIRAINRKIPGLHLGGPYGSEGFFNKEGKSIQKRDLKRLAYIEAPFLHFTHLKRSSQNQHGKYKYELGQALPSDFKYPEVFYRYRPKLVSSPWERRSISYQAISLINAPLIKFWRNLKR